MNKKLIKYMISLLVLLVFSILVSLNYGLISISPSEVWQTFLGNGTTKQELVLFSIRMPSVVLAIIVGAAMAISGAILQAITKNELADPGILGINSGAGLAVVIYISFFQGTASLSSYNVYLLPFFAFVGALATAVVIIFLSWKNGFQSFRLVLVGIGVNAGLTALLVALQLKMDPIDFMQVVVWLSGDLWATQWKYVYAILPWIILLLPITFYKVKSLNILQLGSSISKGLGIEVNKERLILLLLAVSLAGIGVSAGGGIAFLGLIAPHIARRLVGPKHERLLPIAALVGSCILLIADTIGRNIILPSELPAGIVVSIISAPYFIYLLLKSK